jgi:hypothetical protein
MYGQIKLGKTVKTLNCCIWRADGLGRFLNSFKKNAVKGKKPEPEVGGCVLPFHL